MGYFFETGIGVEPNTQESIRWYTLAAQHGDVRAIKKLSGDVTGLIDRDRKKPSNKECRIM